MSLSDVPFVPDASALPAVTFRYFADAADYVALVTVREQAGQFDQVDRRSAREALPSVDDMAHLFLAACGVHVHPPLSARTGATISLLPAPEGQRPIVLYPMLVGLPPVPPSEGIYYQVGQAIARMHQALDTFIPSHSRRVLNGHYLADEPLSWLQSHFEERHVDWEFLAALVQRVQTRLESLAHTGKLSWGPIHGDATLDNLLIDDEGHIGIYDFDQSGPGWRAYELQGVFYWAWEIGRPSFWMALTEGYTSVLPLTSTDIAAMPCFAVLNRLWCMGFEAHVIAQNSGQWIVTRDYFDQRLTELRRWAGAHSELSGAPE